MKFMNRRGRGRSRDEVIWIFFFQVFVKVSLLYHLFFKEDVFNNGFWKICIKIANHVEPGLNLLERIPITYAIVTATSKVKLFKSIGAVGYLNTWLPHSIFIYSNNTL